MSFDNEQAVVGGLRYVMRVLKKTGIKNRTLLAVWAVRNGLDA